jgi:O-antigen ligase
MQALDGTERQTAAASIAGAAALLALGAGALACVLLVLPYRSFDLDRFFVPKEIALHVTAIVAGIAALASTRRFALTRADLALIVWLGLSAVSAVFATNHALAFRALTVSVSSAVVFWSARTVAREGFGGALTRVLALVVVAGAFTALAQAYGVKMEFAALNRAPGGTFGNRNFMAHLTAAGVPLVVWCIASARAKLGAIFWTVALGGCAGALVLSRTRAAWLALAVGMTFAVLVVARGPVLLESADSRRRLTVALIAVAVGVLLALALPNTLDWKSDSPYLDSVKGVVDFREGSGHGRVAQYANSARMAASHPLLGVGPGNWPVIYPKFAPPNDPSLSEATGMTANPWPSSDWIAALSERGVAAFLAMVSFVLLLIGGALAVRYDSARSATERLAAVAGAVVLLIAAIEGGFDAVLLLPTPAIVVWAAAGVFVPKGAERRVDTPSVVKRVLLGATFAAFTLLACMASVSRLQAMRLYEVGTTAAIEAALVKDPGSYRIQMRGAEYFLARGQCAKARAHASSARDLFPSAPAPRRVLAQCKGEQRP